MTPSEPSGFAMPSIVVTCDPSQAAAKIVQALTLSPSTWTTQAPHWLVSQPTCVPVSPSPSRRNWTSSVRPSISPETCLPFTLIETVGIPSPFVEFDAGRLAEQAAPQTLLLLRIVLRSLRLALDRLRG